MDEEYDIDNLRADLLDYYGTAYTLAGMPNSGSQMLYPAGGYLGDIMDADPETLVNLAEGTPIDISNYRKNKGRRF